MEVSMELHVVNRKKLLSRMRDQLKSLNRPANGVVLLQGGEERTRYCTDHTPLFRQESYFAYLFGVKEPEFFATLDLSSGESALYCPQLDTEYAVWLGKLQPPSFFKHLYGVDQVHYVDELVEVLEKSRAGIPNWTLYLLHGKNTDSGNFSQPAQFEGIEAFAVDTEVLHPVLSEYRVHKSRLEIDLMRYVCKVSSAAHIQVMQECKPGMKEYELEAIFLHHVYRYGGCRHCSYTCICATGANSSVLHYGHASAPNDRILEDGDMALLDMGAEYHFYGSDITCSFPVNGIFTDNQKVVYGAVLKAQKAVIGAIRPGVSWVDLHKLAETCILESPKENGVLQGDVEAMMENRLGAIFMPHGLGHFLGLDTHDTGGYPAGTERIDAPGLKSLRTVRILEEGMVITVEPGCYFIEALLVPVLEDSDKRNFFLKSALEVFRHSGSVRLEDDMLVTATGCENLTICPREIEDVEAVMKGVGQCNLMAFSESSNDTCLHLHRKQMNIHPLRRFFSQLVQVCSHVSKNCGEHLTRGLIVQALISGKVKLWQMNNAGVASLEAYAIWDAKTNSVKGSSYFEKHGGIFLIEALIAELRYELGSLDMNLRSHVSWQ